MLHFYWHYVFLKASGVDGSDGSLVRLEGKCILIFTRNVVLAGNCFGRETHAPIPIGIFFGNRRTRYNAPTPKRDRRHALYTAGNDAVGYSGVYFRGSDSNSLQS